MEQQKKRGVTVIILLVLILLVAVVGVAAFVLRSGQSAQSVDPSQDNKLKFATDGITAIDEEGLQKAVDEMEEKSKETVGLYYSGSASSSNGTDFTCYLGNSPSNQYNAFYTLYADAELTDLVFLSDLLRPGEAFQSITLEHALPKGTTMVYCALTLVEDDLETIHNQIVFTVDFYYG